MATRKTEKKTQAPKTTEKKQADSTSATLRRVVSFLEQTFGFDINQDGRIGSSRIAWLVVLAITCLTVMGADVLRSGWGTGEPYGTFAVYGDRATDEATLVVDNVQAEIAGAAATDEVLSMGYATVTTDTTLTSAGSYFATTGAEMTLVLPDPDTMLGKNIRIVFSSDGGDLIVDTDSANTLFVAGDGGAADNRATMDTVLDTMSIQAISSTQWGVLDQTGAPVYTTQ